MSYFPRTVPESVRHCQPLGDKHVTGPLNPPPLRKCALVPWGRDGLICRPMGSLSTDFIRRLGSSKFNYWFGYVANLALVTWMISHAWRGTEPPMSLARAALLAAAGLLSWTLSEYLLHRYVYHVWPSALSVGHDLHHKDPKALIGVPWWLSSIIVIAVFELLAVFFNPAHTGLVMGFNWLGYVAYCIMHHGSHHWSMRSPYLRHMKRNHLIHHAYPAYNWGFTTNLWDFVFGTRFAAGKMAQQRRDRRPPGEPEQSAA